jgi:hypothetical protein
MKQVEVGIQIKGNSELALSLSLSLSVSLSLLGVLAIIASAIGIKKSARGSGSIEDFVGSHLVAPRGVAIMTDTFCRCGGKGVP